MASAMRQPRQPVVMAPALLLVERPHGLVDRSCGDARLRGLERQLLTALHGVPQLALPSGALTKHPAAGDVRLITVHRTARVDEDHRALAHLLRLDRAMWIGAGLV